jgi:putative phosphotransacetylase
MQNINESDAFISGPDNKRSLLRIPVGVSNRHVHLCREDIDILFGPNYEMQVYRELSQKGFFAAKETVVIAGPKGAIPNVRLLGPLRSATQIELLVSDRHILGIDPPVRDSGSIGESPLLTIIGPCGTVLNNTGVIAAWRHIHMQSEEAKFLRLKDMDMVRVIYDGLRGGIFHNVRIRTGDEIRTELHLDTDEANAAGLKTGDLVTIML